MNERKHDYWSFPQQVEATEPDPRQIQLPLAQPNALGPESMQVEAEPAQADVPASDCSETGIAIETASAAAPEMVSAPMFDAPLGQRLRAAREARGLNREAAAHALKLPANVIKALETEQYERIGHGIFLRGYLCKYLRLLDLPQALADRVVGEHAEPPALTTNGTISHPRYLFDRYSGSALYLILTGVIVVPAVLLAMRGGFDRDLTRIAPLDVPATGTPTSTDQQQPAAFAATADAPHETAPAAQPKSDEMPLIASMTPFPTPAPAATETKPAPAATPNNSASAANRVRLSLTQPSWVEVVDADGKKLEYGLLPAGSTRDYASDLALDVRIGNVDGASVEVGGKSQDLTAFRHAKVAHLKVADGTASPTHSGG